MATGQKAGSHPTGLKNQRTEFGSPQLVENEGGKSQEEERNAGFVFVKQDAGSAVCVYKRKGRPLCCSTEVSGGCRDTIPPSQPRLRPPDLFSAKIPGRGLGRDR